MKKLLLVLLFAASALFAEEPCKICGDSGNETILRGCAACGESGRMACATCLGLLHPYCLKCQGFNPTRSILNPDGSWRTWKCLGCDGSGKGVCRDCNGAGAKICRWCQGARQFRLRSYCTACPAGRTRQEAHQPKQMSAQCYNLLRYLESAAYRKKPSMSPETIQIQVEHFRNTGLLDKKL